jgi:hypothetical protein
MAPVPLVARYGDTWESPQWAVAINGQPVDFSVWTVTAQARDRDGVLLHTWTGDRVVYGSATIRLTGGSLLVTGTVQLLIRPRDWADLPRQWEGAVEVEMTIGPTGNPEERRTIVPARKMRIIGDVNR